VTNGFRILLAVVTTLWFYGGVCAQTEMPTGVPITLLKVQLPYEDWPKVRTADAVLELKPVRAVLSTFEEEAGHHVIVRHPGGDNGDAWALEFREWLVALGVPSNYIGLEPGSGASDRLLILVEVLSVAGTLE
jgi:hypothetical protein